MSSPYRLSNVTAFTTVMSVFVEYITHECFFKSTLPFFSFKLKALYHSSEQNPFICKYKAFIMVYNEAHASYSHLFLSKINKLY